MRMTRKNLLELVEVLDDPDLLFLSLLFADPLARDLNGKKVTDGRDLKNALPDDTRQALRSRLLIHIGNMGDAGVTDDTVEHEDASVEFEGILADAAKKYSISLPVKDLYAKLDFFLKAMGSAHLARLPQKSLEKSLRGNGVSRRDTKALMKQLRQSAEDPLTFTVIANTSNAVVAKVAVRIATAHLIAQSLDRAVATTIVTDIGKQFPEWAEWFVPIPWDEMEERPAPDQQVTAYPRTILVLLYLGLYLMRTTIRVEGTGTYQPTEFPVLLEATKMRFTMPEGFESVPTRANRDAPYDFAIKSKKRKLEIRYHIIPIPIPGMDEEPSTRNKLNPGVFIAFASNIAGCFVPEYGEYPKKSVHQEFGADSGLTTSVDLHSEFGEGYKQCLISMIHKDDCADAYVFYLFDEPEVIVEAGTTYPVFHALRFG